MSIWARVQHQRYSAGIWTANNTVLKPGEMGLETNTGLVKINFGTEDTPWNNLGYAFATYAASQWLPSQISGFLAEYKFDEGTDSTVTDYSGADSDGTVVSGSVWSSYGLNAGLTTGGVDTTIPWTSIGTIIALVSPNETAGAVSPGMLFSQLSEATSGTQCAFIGDLANGQLWPRMLDSVGAGSVAANYSVNSWPVAVGFSGVGASAPKIYLNGVEALLYSTQLACTRRGSLRFGTNYFGQAGGVTFHYALVWSSTLSTVDMIAATRYMQFKVAGRNIPESGPATLTNGFVGLSGNSIINAQDTSLFAQFLGRSPGIVKVAIPGGSPEQVLAAAKQGIYPLFRPNAPYNVALGMFTPNATDDLVILNNATAFGDGTRSIGFDSVLAYPLSANNGFDAIKDETYINYDANWAAHFDARADFRVHPEVSADGAYADTDWFLDGVHPNDAAYLNYIIPVECAAIASLLPPVARFNPSIVLIAQGGSITFTDASVGTVTSRSWTFGDTGTSTATNPVHTYATEGTFTVSLTVTGPKGTSTVTQNIVVNTAAASLLSLNLFTWLTPGASALNANGSAATTGDRLSGVIDRTGNARHVAQITAGVQPLAVLNGSVKAMRFDRGRHDFMSFANNTFDSLTTGAELFAVIRCADSSASAFGKFGSSAQEDYYIFSTDVYSSFGSTTRHNAAYGAITLTDFNLVEVRSVAGEFTMRINGTQIHTTATNTVGWSSTPMLGKGLVGTGASCDIADLIVAPPLNSTDRGTLRSYLSTTHGTP